METGLVAKGDVGRAEVGHGVRVRVQESLDLWKVDGPVTVSREALKTADDFLVEPFNGAVTLGPIGRDGAARDAASRHPVGELVANESGCVVRLEGFWMAEEGDPALEELDDGTGVGGGGGSEQTKASAEIDGGNDITLSAVGLQGSDNIQAYALIHLLPCVEGEGGRLVMARKFLARGAAAHPVLHVSVSVGEVDHFLEPLKRRVEPVVAALFVGAVKPGGDLIGVQAARAPQ